MSLSSTPNDSNNFFWIKCLDNLQAQLLIGAYAIKLLSSIYSGGQQKLNLGREDPPTKPAGFFMASANRRFNAWLFSRSATLNTV